MSVINCTCEHPLYKQFSSNTKTVKYFSLEIHVVSGPWFAAKWKQKAQAFAQDFCRENQNNFCFLVEKFGAICIWLEKKKTQPQKPKKQQTVSSRKAKQERKANITAKTQAKDAKDKKEFAQIWMQLEAIADAYQLPSEGQKEKQFAQIASN